MARIILYPAIALVAAQSAGFGPNTGQTGAFQPHNPVTFAKPFPAGEQQFQALPSNQPPRAIDAQFQRKQDPDVFAKPFPAALQQYTAFQPQGVVPSVTPRGFFGQQYDYRFAKPFPVGEQQFTTYFKQPAAITPQGWYPQPPDVFKKPFPVAEQIFTAAPEPEPFPPPNGWWGFQFDYRFAKPFPAALQQYTAFQPQGVVPPFLPPGSGKRYLRPTDYLPKPAFNAKPNPKFRPVWDKPLDGKIEQPKPQQPAGPPPLPPASIFGGGAQPQQPTLNPASLPNFAHLVPHDPLGLMNRMQDAQDQSDAIAVLKKLGLIG